MTSDHAPHFGECEGCKKKKMILLFDRGLWRCQACHALRAMVERWDDERVIYF